MIGTRTKALRLGTRASALALAQSGLVADSVQRQLARRVELVHITTAGDRSAAPIQQLGTGVFVSALRDALVAGEIDLAVHSYKDLPTAPAGGLVIAAVPPRADARDALVARDSLTLATLPAGARIGTGAPRRIAQVLAQRPDVTCVPIRGNVDTRLRMVADGRLDAVLLAHAGLSRLGRADETTELLDPAVMLPAPAQGALAVECRADDHALVGLLASLDDPSGRATVVAERALLAALEAGCSAPVGAYAEITGETSFHLRGSVTAPDGSAAVRLGRSGSFTDPDATGRSLAADLLAAGAASLMGSPA